MRRRGAGGKDGGQTAVRERANGFVLGAACKEAKSDSRKVPVGDRELEESRESSGCTGSWMAGCKLCALWHVKCLVLQKLLVSWAKNIPHPEKMHVLGSC